MIYKLPRPLEPSDDLGSFRCGDEVLDEWLAKYALTNHRSGSARVFVVTSDDEARVVAYYTFSSASVIRASTPYRIGRGMPDPVPAFLIGRLAVDKDDRGIGGHLLRDAIARAVRLSDEVAARMILVHASTREAASFYEHFDFEPSPLDELHLMLLMKDARALMGR